MKYRNSLLSGAFCTGLLVLSACGAPQQIAYFQDFNQNPDTLINLKSAVITAKPTDKLYIGVKSKDPQISQLFNLTGTATTSTVAKDAYYYTVDSKGNIDFPVLGTVHVANLSREQVAEKIKKGQGPCGYRGLEQSPLLRDGRGKPSWTVCHRRREGYHPRCHQQCRRPDHHRCARRRDGASSGKRPSEDL